MLDQLTKLELQAKLLSLHIIAGESILTILKMSNEELIKFILSLNMCYMDVTEEETTTEDVINIMNDSYYSQYNWFEYSADYVYQSQIDWSHSNQYSGNSYWSDQDQLQNCTYPQEYGWNQWNQWKQVEKQLNKSNLNVWSGYWMSSLKHLFHNIYSLKHAWLLYKILIIIMQIFKYEKGRDALQKQKKII